MLQKLREKTSGWIAAVIVGILIIPFAFFGVTDYFSAASETWVAKVGDKEITQQEFQQRFEEYRAQMRQMMGESYDGRMLESPETRQALLERLVDEELLRQAGEKQGAVVPPSVLRDEIKRIPAFQVNGEFSVDQYRLLLSSQQMTPRSFEDRMLRDIVVRAAPQRIESTAFATQAEVDRYIALRDQRRDVRYLLLEAPELGEEPLDDSAVEAFYNENTARYMTDEQVSIEYILLDAAELEVPTVADDETLQRRYEEGSSRFVEPEQRLSSHILIKTAEDADADAQRAAQVRAQALVEQARADGADFAALAREHSEDIGSKAAGGDLGWVERGMTDPAFESALFGLEVGSISEPVKSAEGWHVIEVREVREEKRKEFAEVRAELEREFLETERERRYSDLAGRMVDMLYRDPTTLETAAKDIGVEIKSAGPFGRVGGADEITAHPGVLEAAFSPAAISERNVSDPIELGPNRVVALRVVEHQPAAPIALADVREQVERELRIKLRGDAAKARADELFERFDGGESLQALAEELQLEVQEAMNIGRGAATIDPAISSAAFALQHPEDGAVRKDKVTMAGDRHAILELVAVRPGDSTEVDAAQREALQQQLAQSNGGTEAQAYVAALRKQFEVQLAPERL